MMDTDRAIMKIGWSVARAVKAGREYITIVISTFGFPRWMDGYGRYTIQVLPLSLIIEYPYNEMDKYSFP